MARTLKMLVGACAAVAAATVMPVLAAAQGAVNPDDARKRLDADRGRLEATQRRSKELQADVDKLANERKRITERLIETARLAQQSEGQLSLIESRLGELDTQEKHLRGSLEQPPEAKTEQEKGKAAAKAENMIVVAEGAALPDGGLVTRERDLLE